MHNFKRAYMSITAKVGEKWNVFFARPYIFHRALQLFVGKSLSEEYVKSASRSQTLRVYTRETRDKWRDESPDWLKSWKLTGIGEETGFSTCYLHAFSTCQRSPYSTSLPFPPPPLPPSSPFSYQTFPFAHPHNYSYRLIIALPVLAPPLPR